MKKEDKLPYKKQPKPNIIQLLKPYKGWLIGLLLFALFSNVLNLVIPKIIQQGIDDFSKGHFEIKHIVIVFAIVIFSILILSFFQSLMQTYISERVAKELREKIAYKISIQTNTFIQETTPGKLLTNLTSDVNAIKMFVSQAFVSIVSSVIIIVGAAILLININWRLGLTVLAIIPIIAVAFAMIFKKIKNYFKRGQEVLDKLNKVISESILGATLIRVLNAQTMEYNKFINTNTEAKSIGLSIVGLFAMLVPVIVFTANLSRLAVLTMGGHFVINSSMTLGELAAFNSYIAILIFPILVIGFMSNVIARASASYGRIHKLLNAPDTQEGGNYEKELTGNITINNVSLIFGEKPALKEVNIQINAHTKTAIIGPTAAGKTQLLNVLTTLQKPTCGEVLYDNVPIENYNQKCLLSQIGLVFQDAVMFNLSIKENIAFNTSVSDEALQKAIATAELSSFINNLPNGLDTVISERGNNLSGGQKQRIMLARALACTPKILLLDEFTARVDRNTEQKIWKNVAENYPDITVVSITQNIDSIKNYDQIILLMESEVIAKGTHQELIKNCPEYMQIFQSQQSANMYETSNV